MPDDGTIYESPARRFNAIADFRSWCRALVVREETQKAIETILSDPTHDQFVPALRLIVEQGFGRAPHVVEISTPDSP